MNIFILHTDPVIAAQMQCDKHVVKMILESAQLLSTAHRILDGDTLDATRKEKLYKATHKNHPCAVWVQDCVGNYNWLYKHFLALCDEYEYRYNKTHKTSGLKDLLRHWPKHCIVGYGLVNFPMAINEPDCIVEGDVVASYRLYYKSKKDKFKMAWTRRPVPEWFEG